MKSFIPWCAKDLQIIYINCFIPNQPIVPKLRAKCSCANSISLSEWIQILISLRSPQTSGFEVIHISFYHLQFKILVENQDGTVEIIIACWLSNKFCLNLCWSNFSCKRLPALRNSIFNFGTDDFICHVEPMTMEHQRGLSELKRTKKKSFSPWILLKINLKTQCVYNLMSEWEEKMKEYFYSWIINKITYLISN